MDSVDQKRIMASLDKIEAGFNSITEKYSKEHARVLILEKALMDIAGNVTALGKTAQPFYTHSAAIDRMQEFGNTLIKIADIALNSLKTE